MVCSLFCIPDFGGQDIKVHFIASPHAFWGEHFSNRIQNKTKQKQINTNRILFIHLFSLKYLSSNSSSKVSGIELLLCPMFAYFK